MIYEEQDPGKTIKLVKPEPDMVMLTETVVYRLHPRKRMQAFYGFAELGKTMYLTFINKLR